jgi:hypothetical protein
MESPSGNVLSTYKFWLGSSFVASVLLVKLAPHYSINESYPWTAAVLFFSQWIVYGLYAVVIFPRFISPLRHLPQPKVCSMSSRNGFDMLIHSGQFVLHWTMGGYYKRTFRYPS